MTATLQTLFRLAGLPEPVPELAFHPQRGWRFDFAWPALLLAVEQEGGVWGQGRHNRPVGYSEDCHKYSEAALLGWTVLRFTTRQIANGLALGLLERAARLKGVRRD